MLNVFYLYKYRDAHHWKTKCALCVGVCSITVNKTVQHKFVREFSKLSPTAIQIWTWHIKFKRGRLFAQEKRIWTTKNIRRDGRECLYKNLAKPKEVVMKNKSGNSDSTNHSLAHPEETLDNETLQATSRSGHNGRGQAKVQTGLTCAVSQAEHILNNCEIGYDMHTSLNFSFKFGWIVLILFSIKPV